jgi:hypothetical protein
VQTAVSTHGQGIDSAYALSHSINFIKPRQSFYLVRQGQVAARKAQNFQACHCLSQIQRVHSQRDVSTAQAMLSYPVRMYAW